MGTLAVPPLRAAAFRTEDVVGGWVGELPCLVTSAAPSASAPTMLPIECVSGTTWLGSWTGHSLLRAFGTLDLATGDAHASIDETFFGVVTATRAPGALHLLGTVDLDEASHTIVVRERLVGGTGAFVGSSGTVVFEGLQVGPVVGQGGYHGTWMHP